MNKLVLKVTTAASTAVLLTGSVASVAFGTTTVTVSGNGADSDNTANVNVTNSSSIYQTNTADISNSVKINSNTGDNTANKNTGGDVSINTGDANVSSSVSNSANSNVATLGCNCTGDTSVKIAGNGADSENTANVDVANKTSVVQANDADVRNNISVDSNTGGNKAGKNTGGDVDITTGDSDVTVDVTNAVNQNVAKIGGNGSNGGSLSVEISGNGADSDNTINLQAGNDVEVFQNNEADIKNNIDVDSNTGDNKANKNTGGDVSIDTGDSDVEVGVTNKANFNGLDLSACDCIVDASVKIAGNGADSTNKVNADFGNVLLATQTNDFECGHGAPHLFDLFNSKEGGKGGDCAGVKVDSNTGDNKANENTAHNSDPMVSTGDAGGSVDVNTEVNSNVLGDLGDIHMPEMPNMPSNLSGWLVLLAGMINSH